MLNNAGPIPITEKMSIYWPIPIWWPIYRASLLKCIEMANCNVKHVAQLYFGQGTTRLNVS